MRRRTRRMSRPSAACAADDARSAPPARRSRIYIAWNGATIDLDDHAKLHARWINERHSFGHFVLTPLHASPERARATGSVYWEAEDRERPAPNVIKAIVGEDWIVERATSGELKFVLYVNTFHHTLPESAPLDL